jgi:hypothetical protein
MPRRRKNNHVAFHAFVALCIVSAILGIGYDLAHGLFIIALIVAIPVGYVVGRVHEHAIHDRPYSPHRQYRMTRGDPINTIRVLPQTEPPEPTTPPATDSPRPYYGGKWSPEHGYEPLDRVSEYPSGFTPCGPNRCNFPEDCYSPQCYNGGKGPSRDQILNDPRSGAHRLRDQ